MHFRHKKPNRAFAITPAHPPQSQAGRALPQPPNLRVTVHVPPTPRRPRAPAQITSLRSQIQSHAAHIPSIQSQASPHIPLITQHPRLRPRPGQPRSEEERIAQRWLDEYGLVDFDSFNRNQSSRHPPYPSVMRSLPQNGHEDDETDNGGDEVEEVVDHILGHHPDTSDDDGIDPHARSDLHVSSNPHTGSNPHA